MQTCNVILYRKYVFVLVVLFNLIIMYLILVCILKMTTFTGLNFKCS